MVITKNTTEKDFEKIEDGEYLKITKDIALDFYKLEYLLKTFPNSNITILSGYDRNQTYSAHDTLYTEEETSVLAENVNFAFSKYNKEILFDGKYTVEETINASRQINDVVEEIKKRNLSPFEQFLMAYDYVTSKVYKEESEFEPIETSRNLIEVLNGDKIVCVGYANLLCTILSRLGIPCTTQTEVGYDYDTNEYVNHLVCLVRMEDPKYKIKGIYQSDPTPDATKTGESGYGNNSFNFALTQLEYIDDIHNEYLFTDVSLNNDGVEIGSIDEIEDHSVFIPLRMASLFPEIEKGRTQGELIYDEIKDKYKKHKIDEKILTFIDDLTQEKIEEYALVFKDDPNTLTNNKEEMVFKILTSISDHVVSKEFWQTDFIDESFATLVLKLQKQNLSLHDIKTILKMFFNEFDPVISYLKNDDDLFRYSQINNHEIYTGYDPDALYDFFYNIPYEDKFNELSDNATFVPETSFFRAFQTIFMKEGQSYTQASNSATTMLKNTYISDPKLYE